MKTAKSWQNGCRLAVCGAVRAGVAVAAMLLSGQGNAGADIYDGGANSKNQTLQGGKGDVKGGGETFRSFARKGENMPENLCKRVCPVLK